MPSELFADGGAITALSSSPAIGATSFTVASSTLFPAAVTGVSQFRAIIDTEIITVTNVSGTTWTCAALAAGHTAPAPVTHVITAAGLGNLVDGKVAAEAVIARAAEATAVPRWAPTTAYLINQQVVSPGNNVVSAIAAHTSGASFTPANWNLSSTYALLAATPVRLAQVVVGAATATIDFSSIPAGYETLTLDIMGRCDNATIANLYLRANNDSSAAYDYQIIEGYGSVLTASYVSPATTWRLGGFTAADATAGMASMSHVIIPGYARTVFNKTMVSTPAAVKTGTIFLDFTAGAWRNTAAINRLTLLLSSGGNFIPGTVATLYATP